MIVLKEKIYENDDNDLFYSYYSEPTGNIFMIEVNEVDGIEKIERFSDGSFFSTNQKYVCSLLKVIANLNFSEIGLQAELEQTPQVIPLKFRFIREVNNNQLSNELTYAIFQYCIEQPESYWSLNFGTLKSKAIRETLEAFDKDTKKDVVRLWNSIT